MPELIALEWEQDKISGVEAVVGPGNVRVKRAFVLPKPAASVTGSGAFPIDWLRVRLSELGIATGQALVALPRDEVVVKRVELPDSPDEELPTIVRFQAGSKSSVPLDELCLDFLPLPRRAELPTREVVIATVPRVTIDEIRTCCEQAGLQAIAVGLTPVAIAELVARAEARTGDMPAGESLVVARHDRRLEISVLRRSHLIFSHSARLGEDEASGGSQAIVAEISRALVALRGSLASDVKIDRAWTLVSDHEREPLAEALKRRLACQVQPLDAFAGVTVDKGAVAAGLEAGLFAGPIGMLLARAEPRVPGVDFLAPRQPPVKRDRRRRRATIAGAAAALVAAIAGTAYGLNLASLSNRIEELAGIDKELTKTIDEGKAVVKADEVVRQWKAGATPWLDEFLSVTERMPATDRVYLSAVRLVPGARNTPPKIELEGFARERKDVMELGNRFHGDDERYRIPPHGARTSGADSLYPWRFDAEILLNEQSAKRPRGKDAQRRSADEKPPAAASQENRAQKPAEGEKPAGGLAPGEASK